MIFSMHEKLSPNEPGTREPYRGVFGVDGIAVFVYFDVGYSVISLRWCGISVLENLAVNGF